jgi:hypothetical protein
MNKRQWILMIAMMGVLFATAFAKGNDDESNSRTKLIKERYTFFKENIKPKIDEQRNKLETSIADDDKTEINRIRENIVKQRLLRNEFLFEARQARIKGEPFDEGLWQEIEAQHIVIENLYDQAKLIANKYRPEIDGMVSDLRVELRETRQDERPGFGPRSEDSNRRYGKGGRGEGYRDGRGGRGFGPGNHTRNEFRNGAQDGYDMHPFSGTWDRGRLDIVRFLLWDVNRG